MTPDEVVVSGQTPLGETRKERALLVGVERPNAAW